MYAVWWLFRENPLWTNQNFWFKSCLFNCLPFAAILTCHHFAVEIAPYEWTTISETVYNSAHKQTCTFAAVPVPALKSQFLGPLSLSSLSRGTLRSLFPLYEAQCRPKCGKEFGEIGPIYVSPVGSPFWQFLQLFCPSLVPCLLIDSSPPNFTHGSLMYYSNQSMTKPSDSHWSQFTYHFLDQVVYKFAYFWNERSIAL